MLQESGLLHQLVLPFAPNEQALQDLRPPTRGVRRLARRIVSDMRPGDRFTSKAMISVIVRQDQSADQQAVESHVEAVLQDLDAKGRVLRCVSHDVWERL